MQTLAVIALVLILWAAPSALVLALALRRVREMEGAVMLTKRPVPAGAA